MEIKSTVQVDTVPPRQRMQTQNRKNLVSHICYSIVPLPFFSLALSCSLTLGLTQALICLERDHLPKRKLIACYLWLIFYQISHLRSN